ncbi:zinc finger protein 699-like isoform X2 [Elephas maximus indicus]|nr:zinc finger protein 699-like isoform X2 [Elephas maximus indicus]XP_049733784.1 zinc finger protein 699-like isoform X2 [Elephas maximus indicus]XP_049733785.1 zinc finger protein 699-like isoform X2 [Elephas maximus indicus]XP_049733786.1 zinc finger protein 699-like isoform X2 [Elephas maximus indicus]XP_049733787.1 zinc finger protein 699-like isoform X2 [Elephas maximus indicus]
MDLVQKKLYRDVMMETFRNLASVVSQNLNDGEKLSSEHIMVQFMKSNTRSYMLGETFEPHGNKDQHKNHRGHLRSHTVDNLSESNEGSQCGKNFSWIPHLIVLKRILQEVNPFECCECGKAIMDHSSHKHQTRAHTRCNTRQCKECGESCSCSSHVTTPVRTLTGKKPHKCKVCGKNFTCISTLKNPVTTLTDEKCCEGNECGKDFCSFLSFWSSVRDRKRECKECCKTYSCSSSLILHKTFHNRDKSCECKECGKIFSQSSHLTTHVRTHSEARLYKCKECGKAFRCSSHSLNIEEFTVERSLMSVQNVGKLLVSPHPSLHM